MSPHSASLRGAPTPASPRQPARSSKLSVLRKLLVPSVLRKLPLSAMLPALGRVLGRPAFPRPLAALACAALLAPAAVADFTASGTVQYQDRPFAYGSGFSSASNVFLPVRRARVQVLNASTGQVLATGATDEAGRFDLSVAGSGTKNVVVRVFSRSDAFGSNRIRVTNNGNQLYSVDSPVFANHNQSVDLDMVQALKIQTGSLQANPFNMLDQMVWGVQYAHTVGASSLPQSIRMVWPGGSGSYASGTVANMSDDDGYDDCVQLHELGHVLHNVYSDSDSPGGSHGFGQSNQDPRLSLGEGWASFFGGAVRQFAGIDDPGLYMDCSGGSSGFVQLRARFENAAPYGNTTGGEADEVAVSCALWDVVDGTGTLDSSVGSDDDALDGSVLFAGLTPDEKHWEVFTGPMKTASNLTIRNVWDGFFAPQDDGNLAAMQAIFTDWDMRFAPDSAEPNNTLQTATPLALSSGYGPTRSLYYATSPAGAPGDGDQDWYRLDLTAGTVFEVETRYPGGNSDAETYADPRVEVFTSTGASLGSNNNGGYDRNAFLGGLVAATSDAYYVRVSSSHSYRRTGSYELRVSASFVPTSPPVVAGFDPPSVPAVVVDGAIQVRITGTGLQNVTDVAIDGVSLGGFPPQFFALSDTELSFWMPQVSKLGPVDIVLTSPGGAGSGELTVVANDPPVVELYNSDPGILIQSNGLTILVGASPGDLVFIGASPSLTPTTIPGVVDLAIGAGYTSLYQVGNPLIGPSGHFEKHVPLAGLPPGFDVHVQAAVLRAANGYAFPATVTNVQSGTILF